MRQLLLAVGDDRSGRVPKPATDGNILSSQQVKQVRMGINTLINTGKSHHD
jgi:hypothetical protein